MVNVFYIIKTCFYLFICAGAYVVIPVYIYAQDLSPETSEIIQKDSNVTEQKNSKALDRAKAKETRKTALEKKRQDRAEALAIRANLSKDERKAQKKEQALIRKKELEEKNEVEGFGLGIELIEPIVQLSVPEGANVALNIVVSYSYLWNFGVRVVNKTIFPRRGGFLNTTLVGLRIYSSRKFGSSLFLGTAAGWSISNVPWLNNGFEMEVTGGYRYLFKFRMYLDGALGGRFKITSNKMEPLFVLALGYII